MFHYFVSYTYSGNSYPGSTLGFGCCEVTRNTPITEMSDIQEIWIGLSKKMPHLGNFSVINYQLLREEPDAK